MNLTLFRNSHVRAGALALLLCATPGFAADASPSSDDALTASVQAALAADKRLQVLSPIEVKTRDGVVSLAGEVGSASQVYRAVETTRTVDGVKDVDTFHLDAGSH
ncbi:MAG: BON domain-containing protein [Panacagrimonas sp.]